MTLKISESLNHLSTQQLDPDVKTWLTLEIVNGGISLLKTHRLKVYIKETKKLMYIHRYIWEKYRTPIANGFTIDHKDGDANNNKFDNLRLATHSQNIQNSKKQKNNTSGYKGISISINNNGNHYYNASIFINGKQMPKYFKFDPNNFLSEYDAKANAIKWRNEMVELHYEKEFYIKDRSN